MPIKVGDRLLYLAPQLCSHVTGSWLDSNQPPGDNSHPIADTRFALSDAKFWGFKPF